PQSHTVGAWIPHSGAGLTRSSALPAPAPGPGDTPGRCRRSRSVPYRALVNAAALLSLPGMEDDLSRLEPALRGAVQSGDPFMDEVTTHLINAGGKRLRPGLALAAATSGRGAASD